MKWHNKPPYGSSKPPLAPAPPEAIERLQAYGKGLGYRLDEMTDLLFERVRMREWAELTPFKVQMAERLFRHGYRAKKGK